MAARQQSRTRRISAGPSAHCLHFARFVTGEDPSKMSAWAWSTSEDERFAVAPSIHACSDADVLARIRAIHAGSRETYGMPRSYVEFIEQDMHVGRKRVARRCVWPACVASADGAGARPRGGSLTLGPCGTLCNDSSTADVPTAERFLCLAVVLDVFSRRIESGRDDIVGAFASGSALLSGGKCNDAKPSLAEATATQT